ncbi:hypothetical protein [Polaromonas sp. YR568]|uniref:hypothetical protein n=1 Tax=Polaromonas sp. YR568 TaxID=1855301 RepID=UPI00313842E8
MGLIDHDDMNEGRQRPFSPPPERFGTLSKVLIFLVLLFFLYTVADWKLNQHAAKPASTSLATTPAPVSRPAPSAAPSVPPTPARSSATEAPEGARSVTKCIVNGKTSYGDKSCASGAKATQIVTKENHNLMAAVRAPAITKSEESAQPSAAIAQSDHDLDQAAMKAECKALDERIKYLDAMARQPQSGQTQDGIREERKKARDRQARIPCR